MNVKILIEKRNGAIGSPAIRTGLDAAGLTANEQADLWQLVRSSGVVDLPECALPTKMVPGSAQTKIALAMEGESRVVCIADDEILPPLSELIDFVMAKGTVELNTDPKLA